MAEKLDPVWNHARSVIRELENLTGRRIGLPVLNEKFMGLLPDDPPPPKTTEELGLKFIRSYNELAGKMVIRRLYTPKGFAILLPNDDYIRKVIPALRNYDLEQSSGPSHGPDGERLIWIRSSVTKMESREVPQMEVIYGNVTQSGKYIFESVGDLRNYLVDRAGREGVMGSRVELETEIDHFFRAMPPRSETFRHIAPGSDEQLIVEGLM